MKTRNLFIALLILLPASVMAQNKTAVKITIRDSLLRVMTTLVSDVDDIADQLSVYITGLSSTDTLNAGRWKAINNYLEAITPKLNSMHDVPLKKNLDQKDRQNFDSEYSHFTVQEKLMRSTLIPFKEYIGDTLYAVQIDRAETRIERFLTAAGNFKQYLLSLQQAQVTSVDLLVQITALHRKTDSLISVNNTFVYHIDSTQKVHFPQIEGTENTLSKKSDTINKSTGTISKNTDTIKKAVYHDMNYNTYVLFSAYKDNVFGLSYFHRAGKPEPFVPGSYWGAELLLTAASPVSKTPGGFLLYGLSDDKLLVQAGIGYLKTSSSIENISWKAALLYIPENFGIGLSYSPLTGTGIQLAFRW